MQPRTFSSTLRILIIALFVVLFVFFLYAFLHEAGHALIGLFFGQSITEFDVSFWDFSAHVGMVGGELTQSELAIQSLAGAGLPLLVWAIFISLVPRKASFLLEVLKLLSSMDVINTLLVWILLPVLFMFGKAPSDDVTCFLRYSQILPLLLLLTAIILYISGWWLFLSKIDGLRNEFLLFRTTDDKALIAGARRTISLMTGIMAFCVLSTLWLNLWAAKNPLDKFSPPQDFAPVARIDLSTRAYFAETLAQFSLDKPTYVGVFLSIRGINTTYFDLSVIGPDRYSSTVLHGEGYKAIEDGGVWEQNLPPGIYQLVLTSHQSPGTASVFLKAH